MTAWWQWLRGGDPGTPSALVSILATEGSAPRGAGTRMLVTARECFGTIGGGQLEFRAIAQARAILAHPPGAWRVQDYPLGPLLGQCCGGRVRLLVEHVDRARLDWLDAVSDAGVLETRLTADGVIRRVHADGVAVPIPARGERPGIGAVLVERPGLYRRPLYLFGAGHVGQAITRHAADLPFRLAWFDSRPEFGENEGVTHIADADITDCVADAPDDTAILILTHDHALDYRLTLAALSRAPLAFTGLIGSATKRARFTRRLMADGIDTAALARLTCPIGMPGIRGKEPDVIAIAVLAQLLQIPLPALRNAAHPALREDVA